LPAPPAGPNFPLNADRFSLCILPLAACTTYYVVLVLLALHDCTRLLLYLLASTSCTRKLVVAALAPRQGAKQKRDAPAFWAAATVAMALVGLYQIPPKNPHVLHRRKLNIPRLIFLTLCARLPHIKLGHYLLVMLGCLWGRTRKDDNLGKLACRGYSGELCRGLIPHKHPMLGKKHVEPTSLTTSPMFMFPFR